MGAKRIKVQKKSRYKTEEILTLKERLYEWMDAHQRQIMGALAVLLVLSIGYWGMKAYMGSRQESARAAYAQIHEEWPGNGEGLSDPEKWREFISSAEEFVKSYGGTRAALNAQVDLAQAYFQMGQYEEALKWEQKTLSELGTGDDLMPLVRYQLAMTYKQLGKADEARAQWGSGSSTGSGKLAALDRELHWNLALFYSNSKEYSKAVEEYEKALNAPGSYPQDALLEAELASARSSAGAEAG